MRWLALPKTIGLAGILAGSALLAGGGGLGVAALASAQPAGALSAQLPAVGVREQNVNSAGRIRVALPSGGVGVNGNVSVNNFPKSVGVNNLPLNSAGQLKVASSPAAAPALLNQQFARADSVTIQPGQTITLLATNGSGIFQGLDVGNSQCQSTGLVINVDGRTVFADGIGVASSYVFPSSPVMSNAGSPANAGIYFFPPLGMPFHQSLSITLVNSCPGAVTDEAWRIWYQTAAA
ncbi:MAG: hypothetical protein ACYCV7_12770 [Acidimicrobiales bacterium]